MRDPVVDKIVGHIERVGEHGVPETARSSAKAFIADTLAVAVAGVSTPWRAEVLDMLAAIGGVGEATVLGGGERLPLVHAAMLNAYQIHGQEFDCVHEAAVVHPTATILPVLLGWAEREGGVSGARLLRAVIVAIDVAVTLGLCSRAPMRFFRPANAGGFGATAGLAVLANLGGSKFAMPLGSITDNARAQCRRIPKARRSSPCRWDLPRVVRSPPSSSPGVACQGRDPRSPEILVTLRCSTARPTRRPSMS